LGETHAFPVREDDGFRDVSLKTVVLAHVKSWLDEQNKLLAATDKNVK
jgi:hypothetical protein